MDIICGFINLRKNEITNYTDKLIEKSREIKRRLILTSDVKLFIKLILNDIYIYNTFSSFVGYSSLVSSNEDFKYWKIADDKLYSYNLEFNTDKELYDKLIYIISKNKTNNIYLEKIKKSMEKHNCHKDKKTMEVTLSLIKNIDLIESKILDSLSNSVHIDIDKKNLGTESDTVLSSVYDEPNKIKLNRNTLYYLFKRIPDRNVRNHIENQYFKYLLTTIPNAIKLILLRDTYAKILDEKNYFTLLVDNDIDSNDIKNLVNLLDNNLNIKIRTELESLKMELNKKNDDLLELHDIVFITNKLSSNIKFSPSNVLAVIITCFTKIFGVNIKKINDQPLGKNIISFELIDEKNNTLKAYLHLDLLKRKLKKTNLISFIKLSDNFIDPESKSVIVPNLCLISSYSDLNSECITINEVVHLFREFGNVLVYAFNSNIGNNINDDVELSGFVSNIMEYFVYSDFVLKLLLNNKESNDYDKIKLERKNDLALSLKLKCFYALFDNIVHSSDEFINIINNSNDQLKIKAFVGMYFEVFKSMFSSVSDLLNLQSITLNPAIISNLVSGYQGIIYGNITSILFSYNAYLLIDSGKGRDFIDNVLQNTNITFKRSVKKFISSDVKVTGNDYYKNFIKNYLGLKINDKITTDTNETNCYAEDTDSDVEEIITITKNKI